MKTSVQFKSKKFPSYNDETEGPNYSEGIYGRRLAEYLQEKLLSHGVMVKDSFAEDWGWYMEIAHEDKYVLSIGCASCNEEPLADDGFICFITPNKPYIRQWFKKIDAQDNIEMLFNALNSILSEDLEITDILWSDEHL